MSISPNYSYNSQPQFSVNHLSEYLATANAPQRTKVITAAKFPKKIEVGSYGQIRKPLKDALCKPHFDRDGLEFLADRMDSKAQTETGWNRNEAMRCGKAVRAFQAALNPTAFAKYQIHSAPKGHSFKVEGVKIKVTFDAAISQTRGDVTNSGGLVLLYAFSADRGDLSERLAATSGLLLWSLEGGQMEPLPRLCMTVDIAEKNIVKASGSFSRFRDRVAESCKEVVSRWNEIEPPNDYDGPAWR